MDLQRVTDNVYVLRGAVNLGLVKTAQGFVAVDSGLDKQSAKNLLKAADELEGRVFAVVNTHGHADHFGGNDTLLKRVDPRIYAPVGEADVIKRSVWEPQYLWQGAAPLPEMESKFLHARPSRVDEEFVSSAAFMIGDRTFQPISLPGHSHYQAGILVDRVLFCADAYLDEDITNKHGLPYFVDYEKTLNSAQRTRDVDAVWWVPAHGVVTDNPGPAVHHFVQRLEQVYELIENAVTRERRTLEQLVSIVCDQLRLSPKGAGAYALIRTPVSACITAAVKQGMMKTVVEDGYLWFEKSG